MTIVWLSVYYNSYKSKILTINTQLDNIFTNFLNDSEAIKNFIIFDKINPQFYTSGFSNYTLQHDSLVKILKTQINQLYTNQEYKKFGNQEELKNIEKNVDSIKNLFDSITSCFYLRGYKDFGYEGEMRNSIHILEKISEADIVTILMLRRHEKDYIIRNEEKYIAKLKTTALSYLFQIQTNESFNQQTKDTLSFYLQNYVENFDKIVEIDNKIGYKNNTAFISELNEIQFQTKNLIRNHKEELLFETKKYFKYLKISFITISSIILLISILLGIFFSERITYRIKVLSEKINIFIESKFTNNQIIEIKKHNDEIDKLVENYNILQDEISKQINYFEDIVEQRTHEIKRQNENILSSINYAKNIQEAILPNEDYIASFFDDLFVFYSPKLIVSGDFYWFKRIENKNISILAVADCTGHGVPGALMSMLATAFLNEVVIKKNVNSSGEVLDELKYLVITNLNRNSSGKRISDGLDIALTVFFHNENIMQFSGANRLIFISRNKEISVIQGDKMPIGKYIRNSNNFITHEFNLNDNDQIYLFSDGFADQFGYENNKKFLRKNFKELLKNIAKLNMNTQKNKIKQTFENWKKDLEQTDDVLVIGLKYHKDTIKEIKSHEPEYEMIDYQ